MTDIVETIAEYLSMGGLFNPEMMEHDTVRNLIIECRAEITRLSAENERLRGALADVANTANPYEDGDQMQETARAALKENSDE